MAYNNFAYYYDFLNVEADYEKLSSNILSILKSNGIEKGILIDLGCGTGELCLELYGKGFELIAVDASQDMLSVFRDKASCEEIYDILMLNQELSSLDLYGTVNAAVSTFDTFNHVESSKLSDVFKQISLFMEKDGIFIFDANTPYKHEKILSNNTIEISDDEGLNCIWKNEYIENEKLTRIELEVYDGTEQVVHEHFNEYIYDKSFFEQLLKQNNFELIFVKDGETFTSLKEDSQRYLFCAKKIV